MDNTEKEQLTQSGQDFCNQGADFNHRRIYSNALEAYNKAETCFMQVKDHKWLNFVHHEKVQILRNMGNTEPALDLVEGVIEAYILAKDNKGLSLALTHKANILMDQQKNLDALSTLRLAKNVAEENKIIESIGYIYSTMSINFWEMENYIAAMESLNKALSYYPPEQSPHEAAWCYHYLGLSYKAIYFYPKAEEFLERSYQTYLKIRDLQSAIPPMENLRKLYDTSGQKEKSRHLQQIMLQTGKLNTSR